jgi:hypothetical protein
MWTTRLVEAARRNVTLPDFWLRAACVTVIAAGLLQLLLFSFGRDQSIYAEVARGMSEGALPYRDRWDFKPPGIFFVYAAARAVFGETMWGVRVLEGLGMLLMAFSMVKLSSVFFADDRPGYLAAAIASLVHVQMEFWHSGQPESFGGFVTVFALWLVTVQHSQRSRQVLLWFACGALFGAAFLLKPPLGGGALVCAAYLTQKRWAETRSRLAALAPLLWLTLGSLLPIVVVALWFATQGAWSALRWTLFEFTAGYTKLGWSNDALSAFYGTAVSAFAKFSALTAVGAVAAAVGHPSSSRESEGLGLILGVVAMHLAGIAMQAKFFEYHFDATLPLIAFIAGLGWFKLWRKARGQGAAGCVAFASLLLVLGATRNAVNDVPHGFWPRCEKRLSYLVGAGTNATREALDKDLYYVADYSLAADRDVAQRVREITAVNDAIFVWGFEPLIYWLSERTPASRFIYNVPQRALWQRETARAALLEDLRRTPPALIIVQRHDYFRFVTGDDLDSKAALATFPELESLLKEQYRPLENIEDFELFVRKTQP